jgi:hypothetical protein
MDRFPVVVCGHNSSEGRWSARSGIADSSFLYHVFCYFKIMTPFRNWVHILWIDNCEERILYCDGDRLSEREYFQKFKWWLRREYRYYVEQEKNKELIRKKHERWLN